MCGQLPASRFLGRKAGKQLTHVVTLPRRATLVLLGPKGGGGSPEPFQLGSPPAVKIEGGNEHKGKLRTLFPVGLVISSCEVSQAGLRKTKGLTPSSLPSGHIIPNVPLSEQLGLNSLSPFPKAANLRKAKCHLSAALSSPEMVWARSGKSQRPGFCISRLHLLPL